MKSGFLIKLFVFCVLVVPLSLFAQTKVIKGVVTDSSGEPLIGVNIVEKGTKNGTITDFDGKFVLNVSPESKLKVSYVGFKSHRQQFLYRFCVAGFCSIVKYSFSRVICFVSGILNQ